MKDLNSFAIQALEDAQKLGVAAERIARSWDRHQRVLEQMLGPSGALRMAEHATARIATIQQQTEAAAAGLMRFTSAASRIVEALDIDSAARIGARITAALDNSVALKWLDQQRNLADSISRHLDGIKSISDSMARYESMAAAAARSLSADTALSRLAASVVSSEKFTATARVLEAELARQSTLANALEAVHPRLEELLEGRASSSTKDDSSVQSAPAVTAINPAERGFAWDEWIRQQRPAVQLLLIFVVLWLLRTIAEASLHEMVTEWLHADSDHEQQRILSEIQAHLASSDMGSLRCVRAKRLNIREAPDKSAIVIGSAVQSQSVEIVEQQGPWSLIRYRDRETGTILQGWAASSFLVRPAC